MNHLLELSEGDYVRAAFSNLSLLFFMLCASWSVPPLAGKILADAISRHHAIFIMESFPRNLQDCWALIPNVFCSYWQNPCRTGQDRFLKAFFSYVTPLVGICFTWDCLISIIRVYNEEKLRKTASDGGGSHYTWIYKELPYSSHGRALVFCGYPSHNLKP